MNLYQNKYIIQKINLDSVLLCIDNSDINLDYLQHCTHALLQKENGQYICQNCSQGYFLDNQTNTCNKTKEVPKIPNCEYENIGNESNPIYSCKSCLNQYYSTDYILVKEDNINFCVEKYSEGLEKCLEADADTTFIRTKYNCKSCIINHLPYNSSFFGRTICHNIYEDIIRNKSFYINQFPNTEYINKSNGECPPNTFTPDGEFCYECNNDNFGMPGCNGNCTFSLKRNDPIKCEGGCKEEYIESTEGVCELCDSINKGCYNCHYENEYPNDYFGIKRKRRFICDDCEADYFKEDEKCKHCSYNIPNCEKCEKNGTKCKQCEIGYYLTGNECKYCYDINKVIIGGNKCIDCDDVSNGGIEGCNYCETNNNTIICRLCKEGYILLSNNKTCLSISQNNIK